METHVARLISVVVAVALCTACSGSNDVESMSPDTKAMIASSAGIVQTRSDWDDVQRKLPRDSTAAASALEAYRAEKGLPFEFFIRSDAPATIAHALVTDENRRSCGARATVFVTKLPTADSVLAVLNAIEFNASGKTLQRWPVPADVTMSDLVMGVDGEELITGYLKASGGTYVRVKPTGDFRISAQSPPPLGAEKWIKVADSTYLRVQPKDDTPYGVYPGGVGHEALGTWTARGNDVYVRTDSGLAQGTIAHAVTLPRDPAPRMVACPASNAFDGMTCRGFPDGRKERLIAYPLPCS